MTMHHGDRTHMLTFWDILIPGNSEWPSASEVLREKHDPAIPLSDEDHAWVLVQSAALAELPAESRASGMKQLEATEPQRFRRVLNTLYESYYTSGLAHTAVLRLASASPREASTAFDETLLRHVIATRAGLRRM
jgi:hypothetical protein